MLKEYVERLSKELKVPVPKMDDKKNYSFRLGKEIQVNLKDLDPGLSMNANICPCPEKKKEELFIYLMRANLLGQGTGGSRIGIEANEKFLTLSLGLPYEMNYQIFKENVEDFVNYLVYWRKEVAKFETRENVY